MRLDCTLAEILDFLESGTGYEVVAHGSNIAIVKDVDFLDDEIIIKVCRRSKGYMPPTLKPQTNEVTNHGS